ncbi:MAG: chromosome segregation protein, partial [Sphingomonas sp.]|nr:chromosome segregation protein [Sphingomonas sp.]
SEIAHQLATARARRDTVTRRLAELDRLDSATSSDIDRELALKDDSGRAFAQLDEERAAIERRLADSEGEAARIATELSEMEAASRNAEAALAELLARQAAMRAERRVGEAALESARAHAARVGGERDKLKQQLHDLSDGSDNQRARDEALARARTAEKSRLSAEQRLAEAEDGRSAAADLRDSAESELAKARAALSAARAEHDAMARALQQGGGSAVAKLRAEPGYEQALAAALGDDADAGIGSEGARRWQGSEPAAGDPRLAQGLECLADFVEAPAELGRRLRQIGVADEDRGQPLEVGQRLVTRDGRMRRWDGFVAEGSGAAAAERLIRANRLAELARQLPGLEATLVKCETARKDSAERLDSLRQQADSARAEATAAEREIRDAERSSDSAAAAIERIQAQRESLEQRQSDLDPVIRAAAEAVGAAETALGALADPSDLEAQVEAARQAAAQAGKAVADKRAEAATRGRETSAARERHAAAAREQAEWRRRQSDAEGRLAQARQRQVQQREERQELQREPEPLDVEVASLEKESSGSDAAVSEAASAEREAEQALGQAVAAVAVTSESSASARERRAGAEARSEAQETRRAEYAQVCLERFECLPQRLPEKMSFDPAEVADPEAESSVLEKLTADRDRIGPVNLVAEQELAEIDEERSRGAAEADDLSQAIHRLRGSIGSLNREGRVRLLAAFEQVDTHFRSLFTTLFEGGQAHLQLVESDDPLEAGLEIMAQPPGKRLSTLTLLSGGEQALTAIALIFALFLTNPAPICVLDEVDAPLDDANVERFCDLLDRMTRETDTRYLIVTHNAVTMSRMHRLYGVTMIEKGISRLVSVDLSSAETLLAAE